ncbi:MAG: hypothetical protein AB7G47_04500 [Mycolicibacterium sp.]|uniref:hypothetical protein n=1 Tax=Mycolicibacterium sp. TaxID=2320850 RepID=UPI003D13A145
MTTPSHGEDVEGPNSDHPRPPGAPEPGDQLPPAYLPTPDNPYNGPPPPPGYPPYGPPPTPGYPPYGTAPPPGYPPYGTVPPPGYVYPQWPSPPPSRISIGMVFGGCAAWAVINLTVALAAILLSSGATAGSNNVIVGTAALGLVGIAFGVGGGLLATRNRYAKGLGLGLMIGWSLTSLFTVGFCTGINPEMYSL